MTNFFNLNIDKTILDRLKFKSDTIGVFASGLCMAHCIVTPFFFIASACSLSCCSSSPVWWQSLDYFFLIISFIAIIEATKSTTKDWVKFGLWISWLGLFFTIINITFNWVLLAPNVKFIPGFMLVVLHVYNMKYCQCEEDCC